MSGSGPIPNRWLNCPIRSDSIICGKFIAFKTPLDKKFDDQVKDSVFYPEMIFSLTKNYYKKKVGLWIDLTNTNRFYSKAEIERRDCQYIKLRCRGFGETPSEEQARSFIELVDEFCQANPIDVVGVHCTHGFNRTGFLIVSYLVEKFDYDVAAAVQEFAKSRPPGIYKQEYINELFKRYGDEEDTLMAPALPEWCFEEEETPDDYESHDQQPSTSRKRQRENDFSTTNDSVETLEDDTESQNEGSSSSANGNFSKKRRKNENIRMNATFMEGVPGVVLMTDKKFVNEMQHRIQDMCDFEKSGFPGSQPVSMDRENIKLLHQKPYMVSWKADGTRYMMYIKQKDEVYFFDRDNSCFKVNSLSFLDFDLKNHLRSTLLDGEMVIDIVHGQKFPRYLVYDIVYLENENVGIQTFSSRMKLIRDRIIAPRHEAMRQGIVRKEYEPFSVRMKDFWDANYRNVSKLLSDRFAKDLSHEPDGLIFQPRGEPYVSGRCDDVLKWKPSDMNSVDFKLKIVQEGGVGLLTQKIAYLFVGGQDTPFARMKYTKDLKELDNKIIECMFHDNQWKFMRVRNDKSYPNALSTAMAVCQSIQAPVTKEGLLDFIKRYGFKDDHEMGPPH